MESCVTDIRRNRPNEPNDFVNKDDDGGDEGMFSRDIPGTRTRGERGQRWVECDREASWSKRAVSVRTIRRTLPGLLLIDGRDHCAAEIGGSPNSKLLKFLTRCDVATMAQGLGHGCQGDGAAMMFIHTT